MALYPKKKKKKKTADNNKKYRYAKFNKGPEQCKGSRLNVQNP
jgi:hypothetical protein